MYIYYIVVCVYMCVQCTTKINILFLMKHLWYNICFGVVLSAVLSAKSGVTCVRVLLVGVFFFGVINILCEAFVI